MATDQNPYRSAETQRRLERDTIEATAQRVLDGTASREEIEICARWCQAQAKRIRELAAVSR
jgi:hypothetical protein